MKTNLILLLVSLFLFASCSSLRKANNNEQRVMLTELNMKILEGKYSIESVDNKGSFNLIGSIFAGGYKLFKYDDYCTDSLCYVQFEVLNSKTLVLSYTTNYSGIKTAKIKGKLKNGYFVLKQSHLFLPFIFTNLYRNRQFRIGVLKNGDLITDFNQISFGTVILIIPFYDNDKSFDVEYKRLEDESD